MLILYFPDTEGWVGNSGGSLYWVLPDYRRDLHLPALLAIPPASRIRAISLNFEGSAFSTTWTQIPHNAQP